MCSPRMSIVNPSWPKDWPPWHEAERDACLVVTEMGERQEEFGNKTTQARVDAGRSLNEYGGNRARIRNAGDGGTEGEQWNKHKGPGARVSCVRHVVGS